MQTTNGLELEFLGQNEMACLASDKAFSTFQPPGPLTPTKSVSQKLHIALLRSASNPVHKLHPENRRKTAGRPV